MSASTRVVSAHSPEMNALQSQLLELSDQLAHPGAWPEQQLALCGQAGVFEWFHDTAWGGQNWSTAEVLEGYLQLSTACLTTTFVLTQRTGACQRLERSENEFIKSQWLPKLIRGEAFATIGISHLTTSRQHVDPVLVARETTGGFELTGFSPWVTGVSFADLVVTGATLPDRRQILVALPTQSPGVEIPATPELVGLSASRTGQLVCHDVFVPSDHVLYGPCDNVMGQGAGGNTGGLQTSTLALGLARAAIDELSHSAQTRHPLAEPAEALQTQWIDAVTRLRELASGTNSCTTEQMRAEANRLALRATQAALMAAKGTGYVAGHRAGRWCQEALFFLVWSCPQEVAQAHLCEFAGLAN